MSHLQWKPWPTTFRAAPKMRRAAMSCGRRAWPADRQVGREDGILFELPSGYVKIASENDHQ